MTLIKTIQRGEGGDYIELWLSEDGMNIQVRFYQPQTASYHGWWLSLDEASSLADGLLVGAFDHAND